MWHGVAVNFGIDPSLFVLPIKISVRRGGGGGGGGVAAVWRFGVVVKGPRPVPEPEPEPELGPEPESSVKKRMFCWSFARRSENGALDTG